MMRRSPDVSVDRVKGPDDLSSGAAIAAMCSRPPLEPDVQLKYFDRLRAATLTIRNEVGSFPRALEIIQEQPLLRVTTASRGAVDEAIAATHALWARRGAAEWEDRYAARCSANRDLFITICNEVQRSYRHQYTTIRSLEAGVLDFIRAAPERLRAIAPVDRARVEAAIEAESRVPCAAIVRASEVIAAYQSEVDQLRQNLIEANLRLVAKEALRLYRRAPRREQMLRTPLDMFLDGIIGLAAAVDRYLPEHNTKFSTYAVHWIKQGIFSALGEDRLVPVPRQTRMLMREVARMRERLAAEHGVPPRADKVYDELKLGPSHRRMVEAGAAALRLSPRGTVSEEAKEVGSIVDSLEARTGTFEELSGPVEQREALNHVARAVQRLLPASVREIILRRFMLAREESAGIEPPTLQALASERGVSRELIRLREAEGLAILADYFLVLETPPARRSEIMQRILSPFEQAVVHALYGEGFEAEGAERVRQRPVRRLAAALVIDKMSAEEWASFAREAGLAPSEERRIAAHLRSNQQGRGGPCRINARSAGNDSTRTFQRPERTVEEHLERLAGSLREWWRSHPRR